MSSTQDSQGTWVVVTGGPGSGKTSLLDAARRALGESAVFAPEVATMLFSGGFPRQAGELGQGPAQRAIFLVQGELEAALAGCSRADLFVCDRGTLDASVYWPGGALDFLDCVGTSVPREHARYDHILHMRVPASEPPYEGRQGVRTEDHGEALALDNAIAAVWQAHPGYISIEPRESFEEKLAEALRHMERILCKSGRR